MRKLISGKSSVYGWSLFKTLTRSEAEEGALQNLNLTYYTESAEMIPE